MTLSERIEKDYISAYKAKDSLRLGVLRLLKTAAKNMQVELRRPVEDTELLDLVMKQAKQRVDSIDQFRTANREDLAAQEEAELTVIREYLPQPLTAEELTAAIEAAVVATGAATMADMGKVMNAIKAEYQGRFDGKALSTAVRARLA
ncbi:MAG: GatB/YqeY domain-containing protein [Pseudomonadota bacterium]